MASRQLARFNAIGLTLIVLLGLSNQFSLTAATPNPIHFHVSAADQRMEMVVNSSRILMLDKKIPRAQVNNPDIVQLNPLAASQIQVSALSAGVTQVNLWDENEKIHTVNIVVHADARELEMLLKSEFPQAAIRVRPLETSVLISGYVPRADMVVKISQLAEDFYPKVINNITVGGVQQVMLKVKVMEVSRTKLRTLGIDWANTSNGGFVLSGVSGLLDVATASAGGIAGTGADTVRFGVLNNNNTFQAYIEALRQHNLVKILAEPTLVTVSGRPASFNVGGEFPIIVPAGIGSATIEYKEFGTRIDFVPIVTGNGAIRLEVRPTVSEIDTSRNVVIGSFTVPGLKTRWVDTAVEMQAGQTFALAGLIQEKIESENKGIPWLMEWPVVGGAFRRVTEARNEIEMIVMVTPELVEGMNSEQVPPCGPGRFSTSPSDRDLFAKGHVEVPDYCTNRNCRHCQAPGPHFHGNMEPLQNGQLAVPGFPKRLSNQPSVSTGQPLIQQSNPSLPDEPQARVGPPPTASQKAPAGTGGAPYNQTNLNGRQPTVLPAGHSVDQTLIGPVGYDVKN